MNANEQSKWESVFNVEWSCNKVSIGTFGTYLINNKYRLGNLFTILAGFLENDILKSYFYYFGPDKLPGAHLIVKATINKNISADKWPASFSEPWITSSDFKPVAACHTCKSVQRGPFPLEIHQLVGMEIWLSSNLTTVIFPPLDDNEIIIPYVCLLSQSMCGLHGQPGHCENSRVRYREWD